MPVAIVTKYLPPTDHRGARIVATVPARIAECRWSDRPYAGPMDRPAYWRATIPYPYECSPEGAHRRAAEMLRDRLEWTGALYPGALDTGYAWTFVPEPYDLPTGTDGIPMDADPTDRCTQCGADWSA